MTDQMSLFPTNAPDDTRPGSPRQWTERVNRGLCGHCGKPKGEPHPNAANTILRHAAVHLCRPCWEDDLNKVTTQLDELEETSSHDRATDTNT